MEQALQDFLTEGNSGPHVLDKLRRRSISGHCVQ